MNKISAILIMCSALLFTACAPKEEPYLAKQSGTIKEIRGGNALISLDNGEEVILDNKNYSSGDRVNLYVR